uniref:Uncharacterized protein n=1 Tax=Moniliophthora roreri TaxID=221103 RepID=A0A0W0GE25_MONRR
MLLLSPYDARPVVRKQN